MGIATPPYVGHDDAPVGCDYLLGWRFDADGNAMPITVEKVWFDKDPDPGLELVTSWASAPGSPTYDSPTTFTVTGALDERYFAGLHLRYKDTGSAGEWQYTYVASYAAGTVTIADTGLDSGLNSVQIAPDYIIETSRYSMLGQNLASIRFFDGGQGHPVVEARNRALTNPADVIREIIRNPKWGLGQSVDEPSFTAAAAAFTAAGLGTAVRGVLGWNRQQRRARDTIRDFLMMRGGRLWKDAATQTWKIKVDSAPTAATLVLGYGDGVYNNVVRLRSIRKRSLSDAVKTLRFHFGVLGRASVAGGSPGSIGLTTNDYKFYLEMAALPVGVTLDVSNPYIQDVATARRVAYYQAQSLAYSDLGIELDAGMEARQLRPGDLVRFVSPLHGIDATFRVWSMHRRLTDVGLVLRGYNAAVYTYDASKITTDTVDTTNQQEIVSAPMVGVNLLSNPDFSAGLRKQAIDVDMIPGWNLQDGSTAYLSSVTITTDPQTISNANYLTVVTGGTATPTNSPLLYAGSAAVGIPIVTLDGVGRQLIASVYSDRDDGWRFEIDWVDASNVLVRRDNPSLSISTGGRDSVNGLGWKRYYSRASAPTGATAAYMAISFDRGIGTFKFDGAQLEKSGGLVSKPTEWKRNAPWGIDPAQLQPGDLTLRPTGQPESGTVIIHKTEIVTGFTSGTNTKDSSGDCVIPANAMLISVAGYVRSLLNGSGASIKVGIVGDLDRFAPTGTARTAGTTFDASVASATHVPWKIVAATPTPIRISSEGGNFGGAGSVTLQIAYAMNFAPTN